MDAMTPTGRTVRAAALAGFALAAAGLGGIGMLKAAMTLLSSMTVACAEWMIGALLQIFTLWR
jgi:hypothetical protein